MCTWLFCNISLNVGVGVHRQRACGSRRPPCLVRSQSVSSSGEIWRVLREAKWISVNPDQMGPENPNGSGGVQVCPNESKSESKTLQTNPSESQVNPSASVQVNPSRSPSGSNESKLGRGLVSRNEFERDQVDQVSPPLPRILLTTCD